VQLVAVHADQPPTVSPILVFLCGGLVLSIFLVGWSFARR
jgi:hypothetical protein